MSDSSIAVKWYVKEPDSPLAEALRTRIKEDAITVHAPIHPIAELGNVLWKKVGRGEISQEDATEAVGKFPRLPVRLYDLRKPIAPATEIALATKRTVYDCLYLALAARLKCPFVTADERLVNAVKPAFPGVVLLRDWSPAAA